MADNRMYLRCKGCGAKLFLAKLQLSIGWFGIKPFGEKGAELYEFINKHEHCCDGVEDSLKDWDRPRDARPFEIVYENDPDYRQKKSLQQLTDEIDR